MILYLDKDALVLSNLLAKDIPELYSRIKTTDREILRIRGQKPSRVIVKEESSVASGPETKQPNQKEGENSDSSGALSPVKISETEWRADQLEAAAGQLIAFANQRVIEERFRALKHSVQYGGLAVLIGVGLFALAPKWAQPKPLTVAGPTKVIVVVKAPAKFGPDCTSTQLNGIAIGGTWDEPIIVTEATGGCRATRLILESQIGFAIPVVGGSASANK